MEYCSYDDNWARPKECLFEGAAKSIVTYRRDRSHVSKGSGMREMCLGDIPSDTRYHRTSAYKSKPTRDEHKVALTMGLALMKLKRFPPPFPGLGLARHGISGKRWYYLCFSIGQCRGGVKYWGNASYRNATILVGGQKTNDYWT